MNFSIAVFPILLSLLACGNSNTILNDLEREGLQGNILYYKEFMYQDVVQEFEEWTGQDLISTRTNSYDKKGTLYLSMIESNVLGRKVADMHYKEGRLFSEVVYVATSRADRPFKHQFLYEYTARENEKNVLDFEIKDNRKENTRSGTNWYDNAGRIIKAKMQRKDKIVQFEYQYDEKGLVMESMEQRQGQRSEIKKKSYKYLEFDKNDNWTLRLEYQNDEEMPVQLIRRVYKYDTKG